MTSVVVFGAQGLVGSALVREARKRNLDVTAVAHSSDDAATLACDIREATAGQLVRQRRPDVVILAAALPWVEGCEANPKETRAVNVDAAFALADACADVSAAFVAFSTEYVFDGEATDAYVETDATNPINEYGRQKLDLERGLAERCDHLVVRTSGVYGVERKKKNFVYQMLASTALEPLRVPEDQLITPTYVEALTRGVYQAVADDIRGVLHLAGADVLTRWQFARRIQETFSLTTECCQPVKTAQLDLKARRPHRAGLSTDLARERGLPVVSTYDGLRAMRDSLGGQR